MVIPALSHQELMVTPLSVRLSPIELVNEMWTTLNSTPKMAFVEIGLYVFELKRMDLNGLHFDFILFHPDDRGPFRIDESYNRDDDRDNYPSEHTRIIQGPSVQQNGQQRDQ